MRRMLIAAVALGALIVTGVAYAASLNTYTGSAVTAKGAGTAKKPVALTVTEKLSAKPVSGANAFPLTDIKLTLAGAKLTTKGFATCSASTVNSAQTDAGCPKASLVASGDVSAALWSPKGGTAIPCDPVLDVWNAGGGKLTYFFKIPAGHSCAGLATGAVAAWTGTIKQSGSKVIDDTPLPPPVSTNAGGLGLFSSLEAETLKFTKLTKGSTAFLAGTGCTKGSRAYSLAFTATNGSSSGTTTVSGSAKC
jgi:hypothetical protein